MAAIIRYTRAAHTASCPPQLGRQRSLQLPGCVTPHKQLSPWCNTQDAAFDPLASNTSSVLSCQDPGCKCGRQPCGCSNNQCTYVRRYGEANAQLPSIITAICPGHCSQLQEAFLCVDKLIGPYDSSSRAAHDL